MVARRLRLQFSSSTLEKQLSKIIGHVDVRAMLSHMVVDGAWEATASAVWFIGKDAPNVRVFALVAFVGPACFRALMGQCGMPDCSSCFSLVNW